MNNENKNNKINDFWSNVYLFCVSLLGGILIISIISIVTITVHMSFIKFGIITLVPTVLLFFVTYAIYRFLKY